MRKIILYAGEDGYVVAECPSLPGCISQGRNRREALANIREAIAVYIQSLEADNEPIPDDTVEFAEVA